MRSVKPGRGPSLHGAIGALFAVVFGIVWMISTAKSDAPMPFVLLGLVFVVIAGSNFIFSLRNATGENRYSLYDITEEGEEPDPLEEMLNKKEKTAAPKEEEERTTETAFCPYCGAKAEKDYAFCRSCGKKL